MDNSAQGPGGGTHQETLETGTEEEEEGLCWSLSQQEEETTNAGREDEKGKEGNQLEGRIKLFLKFDFYLRYKVDIFTQYNVILRYKHWIKTLNRISRKSNI